MQNKHRKKYAKFAPTVINPPREMTTKGLSFDNGCPFCHTKVISIGDEDMQEVIAAFCGFCDIRFNYI